MKTNIQKLRVQEAKRTPEKRYCHSREGGNPGANSIANMVRMESSEGGFDFVITFSMLFVIVFCCLFLASPAIALQPDEILIITNDKNPSSIKIAQHYCLRRNVPKENILQLTLDAPLDDTINRNLYESQIASPIREKLSQPPFDKKIKCLITTYGVPFRVGGRSIVTGTEPTIANLKILADDHSQIIRGTLTQLAKLGYVPPEPPNFAAITSYDKLKEMAAKQIDSTLANVQRFMDPAMQAQQIKQYVVYYKQLFGIGAVLNKSQEYPFLRYDIPYIEQAEYNENVHKLNLAMENAKTPQQRYKAGIYNLAKNINGFCGSLSMLSQDLKKLQGAETSASVDSELSMLKFDNYELYRFQPNELHHRNFWFGVKTLMVARLDGPSEKIAMDLVDKAVAAERIPLQGNAYFDYGKPGAGTYKLYNDYIQDTAEYYKKNTQLNVIEESTSSLFQLGQCPATAIYCGWYSLEQYIDAFEFVNGAIGYHIASFEAKNLRDSQSTQWCPSILAEGITATIGPVDEPYLSAFPRPDQFFVELANGKQLVEAYYKTKPYNSWQMMLIGDPLYMPKIKNKSGY